MKILHLLVKAIYNFLHACNMCVVGDVASWTICLSGRVGCMHHPDNNNNRTREPNIRNEKHGFKQAKSPSDATSCVQHLVQCKPLFAPTWMCMQDVVANIPTTKTWAQIRTCPTFAPATHQRVHVVAHPSRLPRLCIYLSHLSGTLIMSIKRSIIHAAIEIRTGEWVESRSNSTQR